MSADLLALVVRATLAASAAIIVVLLVRQPLRAAFGAQIAYAFWLLVPFATLAIFMPARRIFVEEPDAAIPAVVAPVEPVVANAPPMSDATSALQSLEVAPWLLALWALGVGMSVAALVIGQRRFIINAYSAGPAVVGVLRPRIVLPADFEQRFTAAERDLVLAHERSHLAAGDAQINALAALVQCLNWFNPLVHVARAALRVDQELACDARVMALHAHAKRTYAEAMLKTQLTAAHAVPLGCQWPPLGAGPLKQRIAMLARPLPTRARLCAGALTCMLATFALAGAVWIAQPPRVAYAAERNAHPLSGVLGARLVTALQEGQMTEARELVEAGANVNYFLAGDGTPLVIAARHGDRQLTEYLIESGADVNQAAPGDGSPLIMAAGHGHMDVVRLLIERGANVNGYVRGDETPLIAAAQNNRVDAAQYLIQHGADVNLEVEAARSDTPRRRSPLGEARRRSHHEMVRLLIAQGAHP